MRQLGIDMNLDDLSDLVKDGQFALAVGLLHNGENYELHSISNNGTAMNDVIRLFTFIIKVMKANDIITNKQAKEFLENYG